jgi:hypothetical protein
VEFVRFLQKNGGIADFAELLMKNDDMTKVDI